MRVCCRDSALCLSWKPEPDRHKALSLPPLLWEPDRHKALSLQAFPHSVVNVHRVPSRLRDRPLRGGGDQRAVSGEDAAGIVRGWLLPFGEACGDLFGGEFHVEAALFYIEDDDVAVAQG